MILIAIISGGHFGMKEVERKAKKNGSKAGLQISSLLDKKETLIFPILFRSNLIVSLRTVSFFQLFSCGSDGRSTIISAIIVTIVVAKNFTNAFS